MSVEVAMINTSLSVVITEDGQELPIVAAIDADGNDCDPDDAVACTAGPDNDGLWLAIDLRQFERVTMQ